MNSSSSGNADSATHKRSHARDLAWLPLAIIGLVLLALWWILPQLLTNGANLSSAQRLMAQSAMRDSLGRVGEALLIFWGATLVWRYLQGLGAIIENSAQTLAAAERTTFFAAQAGETQRYASAMALLASSQLEVRLGGVYALERLARESARDHGPIMEVLAATLRDRATWVAGETVAAQLPADLQAIATVIGRRQVAFDASENPIDLHATALARAYLPGANLAGAFLYGANLQGAILQNANLRGARLWNADLTDATLEGAQLQGADLTGVAGLTPPQLKGAKCDDATKFPQHLRALAQTARAQSNSNASGQVKTQAAPEANNAENLKLPSTRSPVV